MAGKKLDYWIVYVLTDPRDGSARYVGATSAILRRRLDNHCAAARGARPSNEQKALWLLGLLSVGLRPEIAELERSATIEEAYESEQFYISYFRAIGASLLNRASGGHGASGLKHSAETRAKMRDAKVGVKPSAETLAKRSAAMTGRKHSAETLAKIGAASAGRTHSEETRKKLSMAGAGNKNRLGKPQSEEVRARIRASHLLRQAKLKSESEA